MFFTYGNFSKTQILICRFKDSEKRFENYIPTCVVILSLYISYLLCRDSVTIKFNFLTYFCYKCSYKNQPSEINHFNIHSFNNRTFECGKCTFVTALLIMDRIMNRDFSLYITYKSPLANQALAPVSSELQHICPVGCKLLTGCYRECSCSDSVLWLL